jgi:drug/metabolite transporter (DMT)-like permease
VECPSYETAADDDDSYKHLLQTFLEDYAPEALAELQTIVTYGQQHHDDHPPSSAVVVSSSPFGATSSFYSIATPTRLETIEEVNEKDEDDVWRARLLLVGAAALYGTNFSLVKLLGDTMPVGISTTLRFGLAALATLPWLIDSKLLFQTNNDNARTAALLGLEVGLWNSVGYVAQAVGLETTLASKSAFICSMAVVIVPLLDFMAGKRLLPRQWVGAMMALMGVAFLELGGGDGMPDAVSSLTTGDALSLVQPVMFGIGFWRMEKAMHRFPDEAPRLTAGQLMAVFLSSAVYGLWAMNADITAAGNAFTLSNIAAAYPWKEWLTDPSILFSLFWTGCITTALTIYMETMALETLSAAETTLIFSTEPLWGTAFAAMVMGEQLGMNAGVGAFFILTACVYSNLGLSGMEGMLRNGLAIIARKFSQRSQSAPLLKSMQDRWSTALAGMASSMATWNLANTHMETYELNDVVDELMETLVNKMP